MSDSASTETSLQKSPTRLTPIWAVLPAALLGVLYGPTLWETAKICWNEEDYSHGVLLPFISGYFIYTNWDSIRARLLEPERKPRALSLGGLLLLTAGLLVYILGDVANLLFIRWLSFFISASGVMLLLLGARRAAPLLGPLVLNFMAKPLPDSLIPKLFFPLQVLAAKVGAKTLEILGVPVYLRGNVIEIPGMELNVEEACSGLRSLMALLTVAFIVLYSIELPLYAKLILIGSSVVIAIALNVVRVASTGVLAHFYDPKAATGFFHTFSGMVVFVLGLVILYYVGLLLAKFCKKRSVP